MKKKRIGIIALMLSSALIISASATISTVFKCSAAGIDYQAYSTLNTSSTAPNKLAGGGTVATVSKNTVPAGYMMIKSTIMTSNGEVVGSSSWTQNTQYANNLVSNISYASYGTETYYGQALLKLYEGGEYKPLTVTRTPSMTKLLGHCGFRSGEHLVHRADLGNTAGINDRNSLADFLDDCHLMRDNDDGDAERLVDLLEQCEDRPRCRRVECTCRLVAQQDFRVGRKCSCNRHTLLLTAGQLARIVIRTV